MHTTTIRRAAWISASSLAGLLVLLAPITTSAQTTASPTGWGYGYQVQLSRYAGQVQAYELWNEENLDREAGTGNVDPITYLPLLEAGYAGIKAADPNALVLLGAPSPTTSNDPGVSIDDVQYLQQLYAINGG